MKRSIFVTSLAAALVLSATPARAQDAPSAEVSAAYSYMYDDLDGDHQNMSGWEISGAKHFNDWLAVVGDVSGHYGRHDHHSFMAGPRFSFRSERVTPYVQALAGGDVAGNAGAFTMAIGGGVDVKVNDRISIRVVQADYRPLFYEGTANNFRVATGVVFTFGSK